MRLMLRLEASVRLNDEGKGKDEDEGGIPLFHHSWGFKVMSEG